MDPAARARYLRFALEELSAHNGQFEFEALCQELIKARVASNLVTATGPVAAKGDQGRDAETYLSYLTKELGPHSTFLALLSEKMAAFCCTLQKDGLQAKFETDAAKIIASGAPVERIYAMCTATVPVGTRHEIEQAAAKAADGIPVQVFDGVWIAEQLADPELFWVAERYLALDEAMAPPVDAPGTEGELDPGYLAAREHWRQNEQPRPLRGDFYELRAGLRMAKEPGPARPDLPLWLDRMERLLELEVDDDLAMQIRYELAVCTLIGKRDLRPADHHVTDFFAQVATSDHPFRLLDAETLLLFVFSMARYGRSSIAVAQIEVWGEELRERLRALLEEDGSPTRRAFYRLALGHLLLTPKPGLIEVPEEALHLPEIDVIREAFDSSEKTSPEALLDAEGALAIWRQLLSELPAQSLFPLERLADQLTLLTTILVDVPGWSELTAAMDEKLGAAGGRAAAGELAVDRAQRLADADRPLAAISELHKAKAAFFAGDSARQSVLALLNLSSTYLELCLPAAAKEYALAAAYAGFASELEEVSDLTHAGLARAARADFLAGNWLSALRYGVAAMASAIEQTPILALESGDDDDLSLAVSVVRLVITAARDFGECFEAAISPYFEHPEPARMRAEILERAAALSREEWAARLREMGLQGPPFADAAATVSLRFSALGLDWEIRPADAGAREAAERLAAAAEVLAAELAAHDLCLLRGRLSIEVAVEERSPGEVDPQRLLSLDGPPGQWSLTLGGGERWLGDAGMVVGELFAVLTTIFRERSLLPLDEFKEVIKAELQAGVRSKLLAGEVHDELVERLVGDFPRLVAECEPGPGPIDPVTHPELAWRDGQGPTYDEEQARKDLESRYAKLPPPSRLTRPRLLADPSAKAAIEALRADGWRDWQILLAINSIISNFRLPAEAEGWDREKLEAFMLQPEDEAMPEVPLELFSEENLCERANGGVLATVQVVGLEDHTRGGDVEAIRELLVARYAYFTADIPHPDPFPST